MLTQHLLWLKINLFGASIPFALGILAGRSNQKQKKCVSSCHLGYGVLLLVSLSILIISELHFYTWIFTSIAVIVFGISLSKLSKGVVGIFVGWIGGISHIIFVVHPLVRELYLEDYGIMPATPVVGLLSYIVITLTVSMVIKYRIQLFQFIQKAIPNF